MVEEPVRKPRSPRRAIAFADQEKRRHPAFILAEIEPDKFADRSDIAAKSEELLPELGLCRSRISRADRIDKDEIGVSEPRPGIVLHLVGRRRHHPVIEHLHPTRSKRSKVQPNARRTWSAVEREHQRAICRRIVERIGHIENMGLGLAGLRVLDRHKAGRRRVGQRFAARTRCVMRDDRRLVHLRIEKLRAVRLLVIRRLC